MIGIDDSEIDYAASSLLSFGSVDDGFPMEVMLIRKPSEDWIFEREVSATYFLQAKTYEWQEGTWAKWNRIAVRIELGQGLESGNELILAAHPNSRRWEHRTPFKPANKKGSAPDPSRRSHPIAEERRFTSEEAMHEWIESLPHDLWEKGSYLTAGISRPSASAGIGNSSKGRKTFGVVAGDVDDAIAEILQSQRLIEALRAAERGQLSCEPPTVRKMSRFTEVTLNEEVRDLSGSLLAEAVYRALAGPVSKESENWIQRPVAALADRIFRNLVYEENRKALKRGRHETSVADCGDFGSSFENAEDQEFS